MNDPAWVSDNPFSKRWNVYTRGNIGEVFPDVIYPFTWDLLGDRVENGWREAWRKFGIVANGDFAGEPKVVAGVAGGYCYLNLSYIRTMCVRTPGGSVKQIDEQFLGDHDAPPHELKAGDKNLMSSLKITRSLFKLLGAKEVDNLKRMKAVSDEWIGKMPGSNARDEELIGYVAAYSPVLQELFMWHILNTFNTTAVSGLVSDLLKGSLGNSNAMPALLSGLDKVESARPSFAQWRLGRMVRGDPMLTRLFDTGTKGLNERLRAAPEAVAFVRAFDAFLAEFGYRGFNEWELVAPSWRLRPEVALASIERMSKASDHQDPSPRGPALRQERLRLTAEMNGTFSGMKRWLFRRALRVVQMLAQAREESKSILVRAHDQTRQAMYILANRLVTRHGLEAPEDAFLLKVDEFQKLLEGDVSKLVLIRERKRRRSELQERIPPVIAVGDPPPYTEWPMRHSGNPTKLSAGERLTGVGGCAGVVRARARVILDPTDPTLLEPGDILVCPITDPAWTPLFVPAGGIISNMGGVMSHAVIVSRELGIPCIVNVPNATDVIPDGALVEMDGATGVVVVLEA
jgi:rifampicin phosphotransferase